MKIKHIRLSREAASTILLLKPGMDRIDKTCSKKVDSMPPICTCGYSIANGRWMMLGKAAYLFVLNAYFIFLSANIVSYAGFRISDLIPTRCRILHLKQIRLVNMMPAVLLILTIHIIIAIRWMLIKILSAVINDWERIKVIVSGGCCLDINIIRKMDLRIKILSLSLF